MAKFADSAGREWVVEISYADYLALKRDTPLDLDELAGDWQPLADILYGAPGGLAQVMGVLLGGQVAAAGLTVDDFHRRFTPAVRAKAGDALLEAIFDFFHPRRTPEQTAAFGAAVTTLDRLAAGPIPSPSTNSVASAPASAD